jgi:hypothetical protein
VNAAEFEERFRQLSSSLSHKDNQGCVECERCLACTKCTFCRDSENLLGCHYCTRCKSCTECSHCQKSTRLIGCHHCIDSQDCMHSRYLVRCVGLSNCNYCFGCVGLRTRDFHILNEPYSRSDYFALTTELMRQLRLG